MRRREFIGGLGSAAAWLLAPAQTLKQVPRVGVLWHAANEQEEAIYLGALRQGLKDVGYVEGKNIELLNRFADEHYDKFDALADELVSAKVDIIVASIPVAALAAKKATRTIPVVLAYGSDYLVQGLAESLPHPGRNITGLSSVAAGLVAKQLEFLKDCIPDLAAVGVLFNPNSSLLPQYIPQFQAVNSLGISAHMFKLDSPVAIEQEVSAIANAHLNAMLVLPDGLFYQKRERIAQAALANHLPSIGTSGEFTRAGILTSYGTHIPDLFRRSAIYVDKILKGATPAELPIEQPTKFEFVINLKTAKALGLEIPPALLARADEVIE
jgi:putative tryptophan/tyrosine transport system substrate-binding protein